ncbi:hypothetical protein MBLNU230_g2348t1 [Neophaeotheca triangularis]
MAFRKRNTPLNRPVPSTASSSAIVETSPPGVRPSPLTSHPVTSTGAPSFDGLLGGHAGLALGSSALIEESGTTDFAGALLRYYAAEGICQGHVVHVVGLGDAWVRELPGVVEGKEAERVRRELESEDAGKGKGGKEDKAAQERMKIAWRYEKLGQVNAGERALPDRTNRASNLDLDPDASGSTQQQPFCHTFDLTKRLILPTNVQINHIPINPASSAAQSPFDQILQSITRSLQTTPPSTVHRLVLPTLLSPALYPTHSSQPHHVLRFLHSLRALTRQHPTRLTALATLPLELYPRSAALIRQAETLFDGVLELTPFPHLMDLPPTTSSGQKGNEQPQGMLKVHKLPISSERGEGGAGVGNSVGEDLAFTVSRRKFVVREFSLPPVEGDAEAQSGQGGGSEVPGGKEMEF